MKTNHFYPFLVDFPAFLTMVIFGTGWSPYESNGSETGCRAIGCHWWFVVYDACKTKYDFWLVVSNMTGLLSISYMGCHPSHWRTPSFFMMVIAPPSSIRCRCFMDKFHHFFKTRLTICWGVFVEVFSMINGNFRILKWRYVSTIFQAIFCGDIPLHRPYIGLIYGRYLQFRFSMMKKVPSGKRVHNELEHHHATDGKINYFDWAMASIAMSQITRW